MSDLRWELSETLTPIPAEDLPEGWERMTDREQMAWYSRYIGRKGAKNRTRPRD